MEREYTLTIVPDNECEPFTPSKCTCAECEATHSAVENWQTFAPTNRLQSRMLEVIARIEKREFPESS
jgi:hypothetical protein